MEFLPYRDPEDRSDQSAQRDSLTAYWQEPSSLPDYRGEWAGNSSSGALKGAFGFFNLVFARSHECYIEFPRALSADRRWYRYIVRNIDDSRFQIWLADAQNPSYCLWCTRANAQVILVEDKHGGSGVMRAVTENLIGMSLYGSETGMQLR
jgi:hypothetical protein